MIWVLMAGNRSTVWFVAACLKLVVQDGFAPIQEFLRAVIRSTRFKSRLTTGTYAD
jgi:hypothetical protein